MQKKREKETTQEGNANCGNASDLKSIQLEPQTLSPLAPEPAESFSSIFGVLVNLRIFGTKKKVVVGSPSFLPLTAKC